MCSANWKSVLQEYISEDQIPQAYGGTCCDPDPFCSPYVCSSVCLSVRLSVCLSVCVSVCPSVYLYVCLAIFMFICLSIRLSVCLSIRLSVCLSVCVWLSSLPVHPPISLSDHLFVICRSCSVELILCLYFYMLDCLSSV